MKKIKAIIVDDEENARSLLYNFLTEYCDTVTVIGQAEDVKSAVKLINKNDVDLVFLDIEMPNENGFKLFDYFNRPNFKTIFCTAYSEYALKAFEVSAVDYLLKPIGIKKLLEAVKKVEAIKRETQLEIEVLKENLFQNKIKKIGVHLNEGLVFMNIDDICYFEADGSYTKIAHIHGEDLAVKKIKHFEDLLGENQGFFRIHRSYLINIAHLKKYTKKEGTSVICHDDKTLVVARERREEFENYLQQHNLF